MQTEIRKLGKENAELFEALIRIFHEVFDRGGPIPSKEYLERLLTRPDFWVVAALRGDDVIGGLTVYVLPGYYDERPSAFIYDVGVMPAFQGKGVGKELMRVTAAYCRAQGFREAFVEAEADDPDAIAFYQKTMFSEMSPAVQFTCCFNETV
jgi:aminoglycoside 3-N-acetyltransferase I